MNEHPVHFIDWDEATAPAAFWEKQAFAQLISKPRRQSFLNISTRKVGGLRFVKIGRICFSFCITKEYRPL